MSRKKSSISRLLSAPSLLLLLLPPSTLPFSGRDSPSVHSRRKSFTFFFGPGVGVRFEFRFLFLESFGE